jgi:transcription antitermination factor NusG
MPHWRAIQTQPSAEWSVLKHLARLYVPRFLPTYRIRRHRRGSPITIRPWFPGYVFADLDQVPFAEVKRCRGVISIIGTIAIPTPVIDALKETARTRQDDSGQILHPGQIYRLNRSGPLGDILVRLERLDDAERAVVMLRMFGVERLVRVGLDDLQED